MVKTILFLGKFDNNLAKLEERVVNLDQKNKFKFDDIQSSTPDVIKKHVNGYECDAWILFGEVKPTVLLKSLIARTDIIILVYDQSNIDTLNFLINGWAPIIDSVNRPKSNEENNTKSIDQKIILFGTYSDENHKITDKEFSQGFNLLKKFKFLKNLKYTNEINILLKFLKKEIPKPIKEESKNQFDLNDIQKSSKTSSNTNKIKTDDKHENFQKNSALSISKKIPKPIKEESKNQFDLNDIQNQESKIQNKVTGSQNMKSEFCPDNHTLNNYMKEERENEINPYKNSTIKNEENQFLKIPNYNISEKEMISLDSKNKINLVDHKNISNQNQVSEIKADEVIRDSKKELKFKPESNSKGDETILNENISDEDNSLEIDENFSLNDFNEIIYNKNNLVFQLDTDKKLAVVINSPKATGDVIIPSFINYKSQKYRVSRIGKKAFFCLSINSISFQEDTTLNIISEFAFIKASLSSLIIPKSLQTIDSRCFYNVNHFPKIEIDPKNPFFSIENNLLIFKKKYKEVVFPLSNINKDLILHNEIKQISNFAFLQNNAIQSLTFSGMDTIKVGVSSFSQCVKLEKVIFQQTKAIEIFKKSFSESKNLILVEINANVLFLNESCFQNCTSLNSFVLSKMNEIKISKSVFQGCISLKSIKLNSKKINLDDSFIKDCTSLESFDIESEDNIEINSNTFIGCNSIKVIRLNTTSTIKLSSQISNLSTSLETFEIKGKNIEICENYFKNFSSLTSITIESESNFSFNDGYFDGCESLNYVKFICNDSLTLSKQCLKDAKKLKSVVLKSKNVYIENEFFKNCSSISSLTISEIEKLNFNISQLKNCKNIETFNIKFKYDEKQDKFVKFELESDSFSGLNNLKNIIIEGCEIIIKENCFKSCKNISSFSIDNAKNAIINSKSFVGCYKLCTISIKAFNIIGISNDSFNLMANLNLENINLTCKELKIGNSALSSFKNINLFFFNCDKDFDVSSDIFGGCKSIKYISLLTQAKIRIIPDCFSGIKNLENIKIDCNSIDIPERYSTNNFLFKSIDIVLNSDFCLDKKLIFFKNIQKIKLSSKTQVELSESCFYSNKKLESIEIKCQTIIIKHGCFNDCRNLQSVNFVDAKSVLINEFSFAQCKKLSTIKVNAESEIKLGKYCFNEAEDLKSVEFNSEKILIGEDCFNKCKSLPSFIIEKVNDIQIGSYAFQDCESLNKIDIKAASKLDALKCSFANIKNLESLNLTGADVTMGDMSIRCCPKLISPFIKGLKTLSISPKAFLGHPNSFNPQIEQPSA